MALALTHRLRSDTLRSSSELLAFCSLARVEALPTLSGQLVPEFVVVTVSPGASAPPELCRALRSESLELRLKPRPADPG